MMFTIVLIVKNTVHKMISQSRSRVMQPSEAIYFRFVELDSYKYMYTQFKWSWLKLMTGIGQLLTRRKAIEGYKGAVLCRYAGRHCDGSGR
jgi:hypothetical protein